MKVFNSLLILLFVLTFTGCNRVIIRDSKAYKLEALYFSKTIAETNKIVLHRLKTQCCDGPVFNSGDESCSKDGETFAVTHARAQHHYDRLMFLAGFTEKDPGSAPDFEIDNILIGVCK